MLIAAIRLLAREPPARVQADAWLLTMTRAAGTTAFGVTGDWVEWDQDRCASPHPGELAASWTHSGCRTGNTGERGSSGLLPPHLSEQTQKMRELMACSSWSDIRRNTHQSGSRVHHAMLAHARPSGTRTPSRTTTGAQGPAIKEPSKTPRRPHLTLDGCPQTSRYEEQRKFQAVKKREATKPRRRASGPRRAYADRYRDATHVHTRPRPQHQSPAASDREQAS